jgi:hypothetical protein
MTTESTLILLGILTALVPFLGLPYAWLMWIVPLLGLSIAATGVMLRAKRLTSESGPRRIVETVPPQVLDEAPAA